MGLVNCVRLRARRAPAELSIYTSEVALVAMYYGVAYLHSPYYLGQRADRRVCIYILCCYQMSGKEINNDPRQHGVIVIPWGHCLFIINMANHLSQDLSNCVTAIFIMLIYGQ